MQRLIEFKIRMPKRNFIASRVLLCRSTCMYVRQYGKYIKSIQYSVKLMIKLTYRNLPQRFSASESQGDLVAHYGSRFQRVSLNPRCGHPLCYQPTFVMTLSFFAPFRQTFENHSFRWWFSVAMVESASQELKVGLYKFTIIVFK